MAGWPGICVRLYSEEDFAARNAFTEPEILRTNLASVLLQMAAIGLGDIEDFPFVDPPDRRNIKDGIALLEELGGTFSRDQAWGEGAGGGLGDGGVGAVVGGRAGGGGGAVVGGLAGGGGTGAWRLTAIGRKLAQLPLDPRLGRMVLEAARLGCLDEVLVIAAGLSVQDPRERPADKQQAADELHARFSDHSSDFMSYLALWRYLEERQRELSSSQFRRLCRRELISLPAAPRNGRTCTASSPKYAGSSG